MTQSQDTPDTQSVTTKLLNAPTAKYSAALVLFMLIAVEPVAAQQDFGYIYCGTAIETFINITFTALIGLAVPIAMLYTGLSGYRYMRSGGNPDKEAEAKNQLKYSLIGMGVIVLVIIFPELADKLFSQFGYAISDCVKPF